MNANREVRRDQGEAASKAGLIPEIQLLTSPDWKDYELLDSGGGQKLERYGSYEFVRPEAQAVWQPALPAGRWEAAHAVFKATSEESGGHWQFKKKVPEQWPLAYKGLKFQVQAGGGRHLGVFPEQAAHWDWTQERIQAALSQSKAQPVRVLNLFGYTGMASLAAAAAGAHVTHVDASKKAIRWGRDNQALSGLEDRPIRWLVDDVFKFVQREVRRGSQYEGIILDPPKFGRGPEGQVWEFFESLPDLLQTCRQLLGPQPLLGPQQQLGPQPLFVVLTAYAIRASALSVYYALQEMVSGLGGAISTGELALKESSRGRLLSTAIYARWNR